MDKCKQEEIVQREAKYDRKMEELQAIIDQEEERYTRDMQKQQEGLKRFRIDIRLKHFIKKLNATGCAPHRCRVHVSEIQSRRPPDGWPLRGGRRGPMPVQLALRHLDLQSTVFPLNSRRYFTQAALRQAPPWSQQRVPRRCSLSELAALCVVMRASCRPHRFGQAKAVVAPTAAAVVAR